MSPVWGIFKILVIQFFNVVPLTWILKEKGEEDFLGVYGPGDLILTPVSAPSVFPSSLIASSHSGWLVHT